MHTYRLGLAGCSFLDHKNKKLVDFLDLHEKTEVTLDLVPEPDNEMDPYAVAVHFDGTHVGWVPRRACKFCNYKLAQEDNHCPKCKAKITSPLTYVSKTVSEAIKNDDLVSIKLAWLSIRDIVTPGVEITVKCNDNENTNPFFPGLQSSCQSQR